MIVTYKGRNYSVDGEWLHKTKLDAYRHGYEDFVEWVVKLPADRKLMFMYQQGKKMYRRKTLPELLEEFEAELDASRKKEVRK